MKTQLTDAMKDAMRAKDKPRLSAIRLMLSEVKRIEVDERIEISDERLIAILDKMIKQRRDSITQVRSGESTKNSQILRSVKSVSSKTFYPQP